MKPDKDSSLHLLLVALAFGLALGFRLIRLGAAPLGDMEAEIALQALAAAQRSSVNFGPFMSIVGLTGIDFFLFSTSNFLARFWHAVFGACIVFVPFLFREKIGRWPAAAASLILAISPDMVGLSRITGSSMMALVCVLLGLGFLVNMKPILSGGSFALALMSGQGFWMGVIILGLSGLISTWLVKEAPFLTGIFSQKTGKFWIRFGLAFLITMGVVGTSFFLVPEGLSGIFSGLVLFVRGFGDAYTLPFFLLPLALIAYALPALIFGLWGSLRGILLKSETDLFLVIWWVVGMLVVFLYPSSEPADMIWVSFPLWILAARTVCFNFRMPDENRLIMGVTSAAVILLFAFLLLGLRSLESQTLTSEQQTGTLIAIFGSVVLLVAVVLLVDFGWSEEIALPGLLLGLLLVFGAWMASTGIKSTSLVSEPAYTLWYPDEPAYSTRWLEVSIDRIMDGNKMLAPAIEIVVSDSHSPALEWTLKDNAQVHFEAFVPPQFQPGILITGLQDFPELANSYRGQDLVWSRQVAWDVMSPGHYFSWLLSGKAPTVDEHIILWVRTDLMADAQLLP
ncbi:MAG: hypothetical protein ACOX7C_01720 [Brevefilum sp.]|jgi:hypothetical protein